MEEKPGISAEDDRVPWSVSLFLWDLLNETVGFSLNLSLKEFLPLNSLSFSQIAAIEL